MLPKPKILIVWVILVATLFYLMTLSMKSRSAPEEVNYTGFLQDIEADKVTKIAVNEEKTVALFSEKDEKGNELIYKVVLLDSKYVEFAFKHKVAIQGVEPSGKSWEKIFSLLMTLGMLLFVGYLIYSTIQTRKAMSGSISKITTMGKVDEKTKTAKPNITFADVAGCDEAKEDLLETIEFLKSPEKFGRLGGKTPKGTLLVGSPGVGKTLLAMAVAGEANVPCFSLSASDFIEIFVGVGASRVRDLFNQARKIAPCVVFIDEFDAMGTRTTGATHGGGHSEVDQTINAFLKEMDGFESVEGVIFLAATNQPEKLDAALIRPGRFDRRVVVHLPDVRGREAILKIHSRDKPLSEEVDLRKLAASLPGASGADLANILNEAALHATKKNKRKIDNESINFAKDRVSMGPERKSLVMSDKEKKNTAYHEAGHALVSLLTPGSDPIDRVTIIPRGQALGLTMSAHDEDKYTYSRDYLETILAMAMGGRIGEEILNGEGGATTGAGNDSEKATGLIWKMVCRWGMSKLGLITFAEADQTQFLGGWKQLRNCSEETQAKIDAEIARIFNERYDYAKNLLLRHANALKATAEALLERETLTGEEIKAIIAKHPPSDRI